MTDLKKYVLCALLLGFAVTGRAQGAAEHAGEFDSLYNAVSTGGSGGEGSGPDRQQMYFEDTIRKREFNKEDWKRITDGLDYKEEREKPKEEDKPKPVEHHEQGNDKPVEYPKTPSGNTGLIGGGGGQIILIILAAAALGFVMMLIFKGKVSNTKVKKKETYTIEDIEEALHESDLERFLRESIEKKEYRLAVRIYYLMAIKELSARNWISWKKDKTNNQYLFEMSQRPNFSLFREITRLFEYTWYGDMTVGEMQFQAIDPRFRQFLNELKNLPA